MAKDVIIAVGEASKTFNGMIAVNATGAFIWDHLLCKNFVLILQHLYDCSELQ